MEMRGLKDSIHYATTCLNVANAYRAAGKLQESLMRYQAVFTIYEDKIDKNDMLYAGLYNNMSLLYQELGDSDILYQPCGTITASFPNFA